MGNNPRHLELPNIPPLVCEEVFQWIRVGNKQNTDQ